MLRTRDSAKNEKGTGFLVSGKFVKRQQGMFYWYSWGRQEFDIRIMREVLRLPDTSEDRIRTCVSFKRTCASLSKALSGSNFSEVIKLHDAEIEKRRTA
jgi:hypothetical protein